MRNFRPNTNRTAALQRGGMRRIALLAVACVGLTLTAEARDMGWTHRIEEGEDATSAHYYFFRSDGERVDLVRWVWNGGAQQAPTVTDYVLEPGKITVRKFTGKRGEVNALTSGREVKLTLVKEYTITSANSEVPLLSAAQDGRLTKEQRHDLNNLIELLARDRPPAKKSRGR